jgi:predicted sugar kinase
VAEDSMLELAQALFWGNTVYSLADRRRMQSVLRGIAMRLKDEGYGDAAQYILLDLENES